jgi:hypothetical protein
MSPRVFSQKLHGEKRKFEMVHSYEATASCLVTKAQVEVILLVMQLILLYTIYFCLYQ